MDFYFGIFLFAFGWLLSSSVWACWYMSELNRQAEKQEALRRQVSKYKALYELHKMEKKE